MWEDGPADPAEGAAWSGRAGAQAFAAVEAATDWLLGYPFVFRALARRIGAGDVLVDYGCGPGKVADHAARSLGARVLGVDTSPEMLALARTRGRGGGVPPRRERPGDRPGGRLRGRGDVQPRARLAADRGGRPRGIHRDSTAAAPGAPFVLLATDPACNGREYASLRIGEPGTAYAPGQEITVRLRRTDGTWQEMRNHAWPAATYPPLLERAGFRGVVQHHPSVEEAASVADPELVRSRSWAAERERPPLVITTALAV